MFYHPILFNRKRGQFGLLWIAAHNPSKLTKHEVIEYDLELKIEEVIEYVFNGQFKKPRLSLNISSHLMYGLCMVLYKKTLFLHNDCLAFQNDLKPFIIAQKTPKRTKKVEREVVLPEIQEIPRELQINFDVPPDVTFNVQVDPQQLRKITLQEEYQGELVVQQDDFFGDESEVAPFMLFDFDVEMNFDRLTVTQADVTQQNTDLLRSGTNKTPFQRAVQEARTPLSRIDVNRQTDYQSMPSLIPSTQDLASTAQALHRKSTVNQRSSLVDSDQPSEDLQPQGHLFEDTGIQPFDVETGLGPLAPIVEDMTIAMETEDAAVPPAPIILEGEVLVSETVGEAPQEVPLKKRALKRPRGLIIDTVTTISDTEMRDRMKVPTRPFKLPDELNISKVFKAQSFNGLKQSNLFIQRDIFFKQPRVRQFNIVDQFISTNFTSALSTSDFTLALTKIAEKSSSRSLTQTPEKRAARQSLNKNVSRDEESKVSDARGSIFLQKSANGTLERTSGDFTAGAPLDEPPLPIEMPPIYESAFEELPLLPLMETTTSAPAVEPQEKDDGNLIMEIQYGKKYFHEIVNPQNSTRRRAASMFYKLLKLSGESKMLPEQETAYGPIKLKLKI